MSRSSFASAHNLVEVLRGTWSFDQDCRTIGVRPGVIARTLRARPALEPPPLERLVHPLARYRRVEDEWLQYIDERGQQRGRLPGLGAVEGSQREQVVDVTPRRRPPFELDLRPKPVLELDDAGVEVAQVGGGADRSVLEVQPDLDRPPVAIRPDLVVHPFVVEVDLQQMAVGARLEVAQPRRHVAPDTGDDTVKKRPPRQRDRRPGAVSGFRRVARPVATNIRWRNRH